MHSSKIITVVVLFFLIGSSHIAQADDTSSSQKAVLVTGASSGIGKRIAETLAKRGVFVYAGARKEKDLSLIHI